MPGLIATYRLTSSPKVCGLATLLVMCAPPCAVAKGRKFGGCRVQLAGSLPSGYQVAARAEVEIGNTPLSLPALIQRTWPDQFPSSSAAKRACRRSLVLVDGEVGACGDEVGNNAILEVIARVSAPAPGQGRRSTGSVPLRVVYEDDDMAVVYKPAGVPVAGAQEGRLNVRTMLAYSLQPSQNAEPLWRPQHVHRLDAPTSGLLVVAKSRPAISALHEAFAQRRVRKTYRAVVAGKVAPHAGTDLCVVETPLSGQSARTEWRLVQRFASESYGELCLVELHPHTGRTHQLRRHMASLGHPIVGDDRYWPRHMPEHAEHGLCLSAVGLTLPHPVTGEVLSLSLDEPASFRDVCQPQTSAQTESEDAPYKL